MKNIRFILVSVLLCFCSMADAQKRILSEIPNLKINDFYQDSEQYVWISTDYGICRYNGCDYVNYFRMASDPTSITSNKVICSREDDKGHLWVLTDVGVCLFDGRSGRFENVLTNKGLSGMSFMDGEMVCHGRSGFTCIDTESKAISIHNSEKGDGIRTAVIQNDSLIWAVSETDGSISCYDRNFNRSHYIPSGAVGNVVCIAVDGNTLWIGTENGIRLYDTERYRFITDDVKINRLEFLKDAYIALIYPYKDNICICTRNRDIHIWSKADGNVNRDLARRRFFELSYTSDFSCAIYTQDGQLWMGTQDRGYAIYNPDEIEFCSDKILKRMTTGKYFNSMTTSRDSTIWMASRYKGLMAVNAVSTDHVWYKFVNTPQLQKLGRTGLSTVFCDSNRRLWLNMGDKLAVAPVSGLHIGNVNVLDIRLRSNAVCQDSRGKVWIAAEDGLYRFGNYSVEDCLFYGTCVSDVTCDSAGDVFCCLEGIGVRKVCSDGSASGLLYTEHNFTKELNSIRFHKDGSVWFATRNEGLYVLQGEDLKHYGIRNGLRSNDVESIVFDNHGNAWLGTSYGLSLLKKGSGEIISYGMNESLQVQQFTPRCTASIGNYVCLGGVSGITLFSSPKLISKISDKPVNVKISMLRSHGKALEECLKEDERSFDDLKTVILPYKDRNLTIEYEAVQFFHPEAVKFAYRLKGLDDEWNYVDRSRSASWSYLPSGRYTFELIAMNYDGFWNTEPKRLDIVIKPSPFLSWYSIILYVILISTIIFFSMNFAINRKVQNKKLELTMNALEQEKKMARMKVRFFTNISHELRTSLSLVYGPVNMLNKADEEKRKNIISLIRSNTNSLLVLVDQLLNISRIENDCMPLMVSDVDIVPLMNRIMTSFSTLAEDKNISLRLMNDVPQGKMLPIDSDKFQKILQNLLSNAIKYTEQGGHIIIKAGITEEHNLMVSVIDDGIGMSPEEAEAVFERYLRLKASEMNSKGSGIGLHYTKQLVLLHKGKIDAIVRDCGGMEFRFELPVSAEAYSAEERQDVPADIIDGLLNVDAGKENFVISPDNNDSSKPLIAIIEDNLQLSNYLKHVLSEDFRVITASNGLDGLEMINAEMPDIVTTDVMMEGMDGYELCRQVKTNPALSHIPVVILTAKVAEEDKLSGYRNKANAYITKPFNPELLIAIVHNILEERSKLRQEILSPHEKGFVMDNTKISEHDSIFISKLNDIIDEHLSEPLIETSRLAEMMQISRSGIFRKMKALTGVTPNEYVIIYKLNKSIELLRNSSMNISEIAYSLGFSSPSHFSNTFKNRFGTSPKNYLQK